MTGGLSLLCFVGLVNHYVVRVDLPFDWWCLVMLIFLSGLVRIVDWWMQPEARWHEQDMTFERLFSEVDLGVFRDDIWWRGYFGIWWFLDFCDSFVINFDKTLTDLSGCWTKWAWDDIKGVICDKKKTNDLGFAFVKIFMRINWKWWFRLEKCGFHPNFDNIWKKQAKYGVWKC